MSVVVDATAAGECKGVVAECIGEAVGVGIERLVEVTDPKP